MCRVIFSYVMIIWLLAANLLPVMFRPEPVMAMGTMAETTIGASVSSATAGAKQETSGQKILVVTPAPNKGQYARIQTAIDAANPGDTVLLEGGTYPEGINLNKAIKLIGQGSPTLDGGGQGDVITLTADNCTVQGLIITNSGYDLTKDEAGIKVNSQNNLITENRVLRNTWGIYFHAANNNVVSHNFIEGRAELLDSFRGNGIHLWKSSGNIIDANELTKNRDALYFSFATHNTVSNNLAYGQRIGIHYMYSDYNKLENNILRDNVKGIAMMNSKSNEIKSNQVYRNSSHGIQLLELDDNLITGNIIYNNLMGIFMYNCQHNQVSDNLLAANMMGVEIAAGSDNNEFTKNSWLENLKQAKLTAPLDNRWDASGQGNYWSDYTGYDLNNDGQGDTPYLQNRLVEDLVGKFPLAKLLFNSPMIQVINLAERAFPVLHPAGVEDKFPLMKPAQDLKALEINWNIRFKVDPSDQSDDSGM